MTTGLNYRLLILASCVAVIYNSPAVLIAQSPPLDAVKRPTAKQQQLIKEESSRADQPYRLDIKRFGTVMESRAEKNVDQRSTKNDLEKQYEFPDFRSGEVRRSENGRLDTNLSLIYANRKAWRPTFTTANGEIVQAGVIDLRLRSYDGLAVGPTLRVKAGDVLRIRLRNELPVEAPKEHDHNTPAEFNRTNLHLHGLHVTPVGNGDNVLLEIRPGESHVVEVSIPPDHIPGTFWYHAHVHGTTSVQVSSGVAGALIIEPRDGDTMAIESIPVVKEAEERVCIFQQISYHELSSPAGTAPVYGIEEFGKSFGGPTRWTQGRTNEGWRTTINGQLQPIIRMKSGRLQRFRFIHAGVHEVINVQLQPIQLDHGVPKIDSLTYDLDELNDEGLREVAVDGIPLSRMRKSATVQLYPGYRSDVLARIINDTELPQYYVLWDGPTGNDVSLDPNSPGTDWTKSPALLAILEVQPADSSQPADPWPTEGAFAAVRRPVMIPEHEVVGLQSAKLAVGTNGFTINDRPYDPTSEPLKLKLGRADEWQLTSTGRQGHPFHIHVNPFYLVSETDNATGVITPIGLWRDTLLVEGIKTYTMRTRYENYLGDFVIHCHLLDHEDQGMMAGIRIVNSAYEVGTRLARSYYAPPWTLPVAEKGVTNTRKLSELLGDQTILIFLESQTCSSCNVQMKLFSERKDDLPIGTKVVFVAPGDQQANFPAADYPFPVAFDSNLDHFKEYGVYLPTLKSPLHATFVLDKQGRVRWREVSNRPYTEFNSLLKDLALIK